MKRVGLRIMGLLALGLLAGCGREAAPSLSPELPAMTTTTPTVEQLLNLTYYDIVPEPVELEDGHWVGSPFVAGSDARPVVNLVEETIRFGDLNGDGVDDAAVLLAVEDSATGGGVWVAAVGVPLGQPSNFGSAFVGRQTEIRSIEITDARWIHMKVLDGPPGKAPTQRWTKDWALVDGILKQVSALVEP